MNDGGPAFPEIWYDFQRDTGQQVVREQYSGMTLRDWFAGQALACMKLANSWSDNPLYWEGVAKSAFVCADAMLAARADKKEDK